MMPENRILVIDDNPGDIRLMEEAVAEWEEPIQLTVFSDSRLAIKYLETQAAEPDAALPDLILLDLNMPGTDGIGVLSALAQQAQLARIPSIVLTSSEAAADVLQAYDAGANCLALKPFSLPQYLGLIRKIFYFWLKVAKLAH